MKKIVIIYPSMRVEKLEPHDAIQLANQKIAELLVEQSECESDDELMYIDSELEYWDSVLDNATTEIKNAKYIIGYDCLLEGVFVPDMTDRMQNKSMQQRFREMEPDVFDSVVSQKQLDEWIYC